MTLFALTGTPGSGKTTVGAELRSRGYDAIDGKQYIIDHGLLGELDEERDTHEVDLDALNDSLLPLALDDDIHIFESHLSHFLDCRGIIVLRCDPDILAQRLGSRGYSDAKVRENVQSEILDVILCESMDTEIPVYEIDCTGRSVGEVADSVEAIIRGEGDRFPPGNTDWSPRMDKWFRCSR